MDWLPSQVTQGGPWAALLAVVLAVSFLIWRGALVPGSHVDRTIAGYRDTIAARDKTIEHLQAANDRKDVTIEKQAGQIERLMKGADLSTHLAVGIVEEAKRRELGG